jgi:hypothetical protein
MAKGHCPPALFESEIAWARTAGLVGVREDRISHYFRAEFNAPGPMGT